MLYEQHLARKLGARRQAFIHGVLVLRARARRAITLVTPTRNAACATRTLQEVWDADRAFVWVLHDKDKMRLHDLRTRKLRRVPHPPAAEIRRVRPARAPRVRDGLDYHQQIMHDQVTSRRRFPWRGALRRRVRTLILPPGLLVLVVPARAAAAASPPPPVMDILTEARIGGVCNLWGTGMRPAVLEARKKLPPPATTASPSPSPPPPHQR